MTKKTILIEVITNDEGCTTNVAMEGMFDHEVLGILHEALMHVEMRLKNRILKNWKDEPKGS